MAVSQAVEIPINKVPILTPNASKAEFVRYSTSKVSFRCCQIAPEGSKMELEIVKIGILKITAISTTAGSHNRPLKPTVLKFPC